MRFVTLLILGFTPFAALACGGATSDSPAPDTISKDQFVEAYFELRKAGLRSRGMEITLDTRDSVLAELGLTEEDLITFAEVWGDDGEVMISVWEEVDSLLVQARTPQGEEGGLSEEGLDPRWDGPESGGDAGQGREETPS